MRTKNIAAGVGFLFFGALYAFLTSQLPRRLGNVPGPSFFPWVLTWCFLGLSAVLLVQGLLLEAWRAPKPEGETSVARRTAAGLLFLAVYLVLLPFLGFLLATPLAFAALMWAAGENRPLYIAGWSVGMTALLYLMFHYLFQVPFPAAPDF